MEQPLRPIEQTLFADIQALIQSSRQRTFTAVNAEMTMLYWQIGLKLKDHLLANERADYGKKIMLLLAQKLTNLFGRGWGEKQLRHYLKSAEIFSKDEIVYAVRRQLSWTHLRIIMYLNFAAWLPSTSSWVNLSTATKAKWSFICAGWPNTSNTRTNFHPLV